MCDGEKKGWFGNASKNGCLKIEEMVFLKFFTSEKDEKKQKSRNNKQTQSVHTLTEETAATSFSLCSHLSSHCCTDFRA